MRMLKRALEGEGGDNALVTNDEADKTILMKGPLAEVYTRALDIAYAKPDPVTNEVGMESAAIDQAIAEKMVKAIADPAAPPTDNFQSVYGVSKDTLNDETVVDVTKELAEQSDAGEFILIIDGTQPASGGDAGPVERMEMLSNALECMVVAHGGRVFSSLKDFSNSKSKSA